MYEAFFGFKEKPFSLLPDPEFLYLSKKHDTALGLLEYSILEQTPFSVITGDIGTGKTTLIRYLLNRLGPDVTVGLITNTQKSFGELLQWVLLAFDLDYRRKSKGDLFQALVEFLIREYAQKRRTVLVIDEAQNMAPETLEELRMLSNINSEKDQVLQVLLVGQRGLRDLLQRPELEQFAQRIGVDYHLQPLSEEETRECIRYRLTVAGGPDPDLFTPDACRAVFRLSGGIPRMINLLCEHALVYGYAEQRRKIDSKLVMEVARDKEQGEIFPLRGKSEKAGSEKAGSEETGASVPESLGMKESLGMTGSKGSSDVMTGGAHVYDAMRRYKEARRSSAPRHAGRPMEQRPEPVRPADSGTSVATNDDATPAARRNPRFVPDLRALAGRPGSIRSQIALGASIGVNISFILLLIGLVWSSSWLRSHDHQTLLTTAKSILEKMAPWHERAPGSVMERPALALSAGVHAKPPAPAASQPTPTALSGAIRLAAADQGAQDAATAPSLVSSIQETLRRYRAEHKIGPSRVSSVPPVPMVDAQQAAEAVQSYLPITPAVAAQPVAMPPAAQTPAPVQAPAVVSSSPAAEEPEHSPAPAMPAADSPVRAVALADPLAHRPVASSSDRGRVVIAKQGDSLSTIIMERYGRYDPDLLNAVLRWNPQIRSPHWIMIGDVIRLPR